MNNSTFGDFITFIDQDTVLAAIAFAGLALILFSLLKRSIRRYTNRSYRPSHKRHKSSKLRLIGGRETKNPNDMRDPANQLEAVSQVNFTTVSLLNKSEKRLFDVLENILNQHHPDLRLMAQTSMGEIIRPVSDDKGKWARANASINSKRLDFTVFNQHGVLIAAIEYQGSGHYHQKTFMRDAVKREALRRAGVSFIEIPKDFTPDKVRTDILAQIGP